MQLRRHAETFLSRDDGVLEELGPGEPAMPAVRELEHAQNAGHTDRSSAHRRFEEFERLSGVVEKPVCARRRWSGLAAVVAAQAAVLLRPVQKERAAADTGGLGLDQPKYHLHRDRSIERRAAALEHRIARIHCKGMSRGHYEVLCARAFG